MGVVIGSGGTVSEKVQQLRIELQEANKKTGSSSSVHQGSVVDRLKEESATPIRSGTSLQIYDPEITAILAGEI